MGKARKVLLWHLSSPHSVELIPGDRLWGSSVKTFSGKGVKVENSTLLVGFRL